MKEVYSDYHLLMRFSVKNFYNSLRIGLSFMALYCRIRNMGEGMGPILFTAGFHGGSPLGTWLST